MKQLIQKKEIYLILILLISACALYAGTRFFNQQPAVTVSVSVDGSVEATFDLNTDTEYTVTGAGGGTNHLIIKDGAVWCSDASCPDQVCVRQGKQTLDGEMIVCLPNQMIVTINGEE